MEILLASSSPARAASLQKLGLNFRTVSPAIDETPLAGESTKALVKRLSIEKAMTQKHNKNTIIIAGDQLLSVNDTVLCKPHTHSNAKRQLALCSDNVVFSHSGMCVFAPCRDFMDYSLTTVEAHYRKLSDEVIDTYLALDEPYQCAGSIRFESHGHILLKRLTCNDSFAICGLPLHHLITTLLTLGVQLKDILNKKI